MSTTPSITPFVSPELEQLLLMLGTAWTDGDGYWQPLPGTMPNLALVQTAVTHSLGITPADHIVVGALFTVPTAGADGVLHMTAALWHRLMLNPAMVSIVGTAAAAVQQGDAVVAVAVSALQMVLVNAVLTHQQLPAVPTAEGSAVPDIDSLGALHKAIDAALGGLGDHVIADAHPFDETNRYARFAIAVNRDGTQRSVLLSRAHLEVLLAIWPEAIDRTQMTELLRVGGNPPDLVRLPLGALKGLSFAQWTETLVQKGAIDEGQVVFTDIAGDPTSMSEFNTQVKSFAYASSFHTPSPATLSISDAMRTSWLGAAVAQAQPGLLAAAAWLDQVRLALANTAANGWITLDARTAALIRHRNYPDHNPLLLGALLQGGAIRRAIKANVLTGTLDRSLATGEVLEIVVGKRTFSSQQGELSVNGTQWTLTLETPPDTALRDVALTRVTGTQRELLERFSLLAGQASASAMVRIDALAHWLGQGSRDLGQTIATLLVAAAAMAPGGDGLDTVNIEAWRTLLLDPKLQEVLATQGLVLPDAVTTGLTLKNTSDLIAAQGVLVDAAGQLIATRETLLAWAFQARAGGGYTVPAPVPAADSSIVSRPQARLDATARAALVAAAQAAATAVSTLAGATRLPVDPATAVDLAINLPAGATYHIDVSTDGGVTWVSSTLLALQQLPLASGQTTLVKIKDLVLADRHDAQLTLTATGLNTAGLATSASVLLSDPTLARLSVQASAAGTLEDAGHAVFRVGLSRALDGVVTLDFALLAETAGTDGSDVTGTYEVSRDQGLTWTALSAATHTWAAGETELLVRHPVTADAAREARETWRLQVTASGATGAIDQLGNLVASAQAVLVDAVPQSLTVRTQDVGQGLGEVVFEVALARSQPDQLRLELSLEPHADVTLAGHEVSLDAGLSWQLLEMHNAVTGWLKLAPGQTHLLVRARVTGMTGSTEAAPVALTVVDTTPGHVPLAAAQGSANVWRHGTTPRVWVNDVTIDADRAEAVFTVRLSGPSSLPVSVDFSTGLPDTGPSAVPHRDYLTTQGTLVFGVGETERQVRVALRAGWDQVAEERTFLLNLTSAINASLGDAALQSARLRHVSAVATLKGEAPRIEVSGVEVDEEVATRAVFQVGLSHGRAAATPLFITVSGDDADGQSDVGALEYFDEGAGVWKAYDATTGLILASQQTQMLVCVTVVPRAAGLREGDERLGLNVRTDATTAAHLSVATASAPLWLRGNADPATLLARQATAAVSGEDVEFELSANEAGWVSLSDADIAGLEVAMEAAGLDVSVLDAARRTRPNAQGTATGVYASAWLEQLHAALAQHAQALQARLRLDEVIGLFAGARTTSAVNFDGRPGLDIGTKADLDAFLDRLTALGLPVHRNVPQALKDHLGAVLPGSGDLTGHYLVSTDTLDHWGASLQRQHDRETALNLRRRLALLDSHDAGVPVVLGATQADGSGSADRWLAELQAAGVLLSDVGDGAFDADGVGGIHRRRDADGVVSLVVSQATLDAWSEQLAMQAALATSTYNGGLDSYAETYLRDQASFDTALTGGKPELSRIRIAYAVNTMIRNVYWLRKDLDIERLRVLSMDFYRRLAKITALNPADNQLPGVDGLDQQIELMDVGLKELFEEMPAGKLHIGTTRNKLQAARKRLSDLVETEDIYATAGRARVGSIAEEVEEMYGTLVELHGVSLTEADLNLLRAKSEYQEFAKEGEQISRLYSAVLVLAAVVPSAAAMVPRLRAEGDDLGAAYTGLMAAQMFMHAFHMPWWFAYGAIDAHLNAYQITARNDELLRRTLRVYGDGHNVWDAFKVVYRLEGKDAPPAQGGTTLSDNEPLLRVDAVVIEDVDGRNVRVQLARSNADPTVWQGTHEDFKFEVTVSLEGRRELRVTRADGVSQTVDDFDLRYRNQEWGFLTDESGAAITDAGDPISDRALAIWKSLDATMKGRVSPETIEMALSPEVFDTLKGIAEYESFPYGEVTNGTPKNLIDELDGHFRFQSKEHADAFHKAMTRAVDRIKAMDPYAVDSPSGAEAYEWVTARDTYKLGWRPDDRFDLFIEGVAKVKGTAQEFVTGWRDFLALYQTGKPSDQVVDIKQVFTRKVDETVRRQVFGQRRRSMATSAMVDDKTWADLLERARIATLWKSRNKVVSDLGVESKVGYPLRTDMAEGGERMAVSQRLVGPYDGELPVTFGRYGPMLLSDLLGVVASAVGIAAAARALGELDPNDKSAETRRTRTALQGEIAKQSVFLAAYSVLGVGHVVLTVTRVPSTVGALSAMRAVHQGVGLAISIAGSALVLASEAANIAAYSERWRQNGGAYQEDIYGTVGSAANLFLITAGTVLGSLFPALAPVVGAATTLLPNWTAIGRAQDIESHVAGLRRVGRDAEADFAQTMAAASFRDAAPIYFWFSALYGREMAAYQFAQGDAMWDLLDASGTVALENTRDQKIGAGTANYVAGAESGYTHRFLNFGVPVNLTVALNEYLTGSGTQIDWGSGDVADTEAFKKMMQESARVMLARMKAQGDNTRNWFAVAYQQRILAEALSWQSPDVIAAERKSDIDKEVAYWRDAAKGDRDTQLSWTSDWVTQAVYDQRKSFADQLAVVFRSPDLRIEGSGVYHGSVWVGDLHHWMQLANQAVDGHSAEANAARADRYQARLTLAHFHDVVSKGQVDRALAAVDRGAADFGLAQVDKWLGLLQAAPASSNVFVIASRSEKFEYDSNFYQRTHRYSNYSTHTSDDVKGNVEWVDGSYMMRMGRPMPDALGNEPWWGDWSALERPEEPPALASDATREEVRLYNLAVHRFNHAVIGWNAHLMTYLMSVMERPADQRGADLGVPLHPVQALQAVDPGAQATYEERFAYDSAKAVHAEAAEQLETVKTYRHAVLQARYIRLQNATDAAGHATDQQRFAVQAALDKAGYRFETAFSGEQDNSVAERWVIQASDVARDDNGHALGTEMRVFVRDEGGNTLRALVVDSSAVDDIDQTFHVERANVQIRTGDGNDTFLLFTTQGIEIHSGAGDMDNVMLTQATEGQTIDLDRFVGVVTVTGSEFKDVVRSTDGANHHYIDQIGVGDTAPGAPGDDVKITGPGDHLVEMRSGSVLTGAGDDMVVVREHVGGHLSLDLGAGENMVSFAWLPGVSLSRSSATGHYEFSQVTWILDGNPGSAPGTLGWGLTGSMQNVHQVVGSSMGDWIDLNGGIEGVQASGGDDRITLRSGNVVVDGGQGADHVVVHGAHNTRVMMDNVGDVVTLASTVQDAMVLVGASAGDEGAPNGVDVQRGTIDASASAGKVVIDVIDGVVTVKVGTGPTVINLLTATARVIIEDTPNQTRGPIEFHLLPGAPLDDLALRMHLATSVTEAAAATGHVTSLLDHKVQFVTRQSPHNAFNGVSVKGTNLQGQVVSIDLDQALPDPLGSDLPASTLQVLDADSTLHAWAGVRTVIALDSPSHIGGAWTAAQAQAYAQALQDRQVAAHGRAADAFRAMDVLASLRASVVPGSSLQAWRDPVPVAQQFLSDWVREAGARVDRWVFNAGDLVHSGFTLGQADLGAALAELGWSVEHRSAVVAALQGRAAYSARLNTLVVSADTLAAWQSSLQALRAQTPDPTEAGWLDDLGARLAAVDLTGPDAGMLSADKMLAHELIKSLALVGAITAAQAVVITGVDLDLRGDMPVLHVVQGGTDPMTLTGLGVTGATGDTAPLHDRYGSAGHAVVVFDPHAPGFVASRQALMNWRTDARNQYDAAVAEQARLARDLAAVAPYGVVLASGQALYTGLTHDAVHDTLEVNSPTPLQQALELRARNGEETASTRLWLQVERFQGVTRVGTDGNDMLTAETDHANLLAAGRGDDRYVVRDDNDVVFENAGEGTDVLFGTGLTHTLADNVEVLRLAFESEVDAGNPVTLTGTGNRQANVLYGHLDFANVLDGGAGDDVMFGGFASDTYHVDSEGDVVDETNAGALNTLADLGGQDWVYSSIDYSLIEGDHLFGHVENLRLLGNADLLGTGNAWANRIEGNDGHNQIDGGAGADTLVGGAGNDTYVIDNPGDTVVENANEGTDTVLASVSHTLGEHVENLSLTGTGHTTATGNALDNILRGNAGKNVLDGGAGHDTLVLSGRPEDYLFLKAVNGEWVVGDLVAQRDGVDRFRLIESVHFSGSNQTMRLADIHAHGVLAYTASHPDLMNAFRSSEASALNHYVAYGHAEGRQVTFDPLQYMGANVDVGNYFNLDPNNAAWHYIHYGRREGRATTATMAVQQAGPGGATLVGQSGRDALFGAAGGDRLFGEGGNDALLGGAGDDRLDGGTGADHMGGGTGNDLYFVDDAGDVIHERAGEGEDAVMASVSFVMPDQVENGGLLFDGHINLTGNAAGNFLQGNAGRNVLDGAGGSDTVLVDAPLSAFRFLRQSNGDVLMGYLDPARGQADRLVNVERLQSVVSGEVVDLTTMAMPTVFQYMASHPGLADQIGSNEASAAEHFLSLGQQQGLAVDSGLQTLIGTSANDQLVGGAARDALFGQAGHDFLSGEGGADVLFGAAGDDMLLGGHGDDTLNGGAGDDQLAGGDGADTYHFARGDGADVIEDTGSAGDQDRLVFATSGPGAIGFDQLWFSSNGYDITARVMGTNDSVTLWDWTGGMRVESIVAADTTTADPHDLRTLSATGLEQLVNAMAAIAPPAGATSWSGLTAGQQNQLNALGVWS